MICVSWLDDDPSGALSATSSDTRASVSLEERRRVCAPQRPAQRRLAVAASFACRARARLLERAVECAAESARPLGHALGACAARALEEECLREPRPAERGWQPRIHVGEAQLLTLPHAPKGTHHEAAVVVDGPRGIGLTIVVEHGDGGAEAAANLDGGRAWRCGRIPAPTRATDIGR